MHIGTAGLPACGPKVRHSIGSDPRSNRNSVQGGDLAGVTLLLPDLLHIRVRGVWSWIFLEKRGDGREMRKSEEK